MDIGQIERRGYYRCDMNIPVRFVLVSVPEGNIIEEGSARARNISPSGILVSDIELPSRSLPLKPFQVTLFFQYGLSEKIHMVCSVRWINSNGSISLGLHIDRMPEKHRFRLNEFVLRSSTTDNGNKTKYNKNTKQACLPRPPVPTLRWENTGSGTAKGERR